MVTWQGAYSGFGKIYIHFKEAELTITGFLNRMLWELPLQLSVLCPASLGTVPGFGSFVLLRWQQWQTSECQLLSGEGCGGGTQVPGSPLVTLCSPGGVPESPSPGLEEWFFSHVCKHHSLLPPGLATLEEEVLAQKSLF